MEGVVYEPSPPCDAPLRQCEFLSGLRRAKLAIASVGNDDEPVVDFEHHDYAILMTQDCDLALDYRARHEEVSIDKAIPDILLCHALPANEMRGSQQIKSDIWRRITNHGHERYHCYLKSLPTETDRVWDCQVSD